MKITKTLCTGIILTSTLVITGCNDDSDSERISQNNNGAIVNGEFKYAAYDIFTDVVDNKYKRGWGKLQYLITENGIKQDLITVVGSSPTAYQKSHYPDGIVNMDYYVGNNLFIDVVEDFDNRYYKTSFIDNNTIKSTVQKDNASVSTNLDILTYDLSGVGKIQKNAKTGFFTDLHYDYFPDNIKFPAGSKCYVLQGTAEQSYYNFYSVSQSSDITIDEWIKAKRDSGGYELNDLVKENVGKNNALKAARFTDQRGDIYAAVQFNGLVYEADYAPKGIKQNLSTDPQKDVVECYLYNDTATTFLDTQIKANY